MKKLQLNHFIPSTLSTAQASKTRGGQSFCEWYLEYCNQNPDGGIMSAMMSMDSYYNGTIPSNFDLNYLAMKVDYNSK